MKFDLRRLRKLSRHGDEAMLKENYAAALDFFLRAYALIPDHMLAERVNALMEINKCLDRFPDNKKRHSDKLEVCSLAVHLLEKIISVEKTSALSHLNLSFFLWETGDMFHALKEIDEAIRCSPDFKEAHEQKAILLKEFGYSEYAVSFSDRAKRMSPMFPGD